MKKFWFSMTLCLMMIGVIPVFAQDSSAGDGGYYNFTVSLEKVFPYRKGYVVRYLKGLNRPVDAYLPEEWFRGTGSKGDLILLNSGTDWPHLTVFYKDGEFSHVRLYVRKDRAHESWGYIPLGVNLDDRFENIEDVKIEF